MDNAQLKKENSQLKRLPLFVAVVLEKLPGRELYLRQQGNNQEYVTSASEEIYKEVKAGTKVAVNNTLSVVKILGSTIDRKDPRQHHRRPGQGHGAGHKARDHLR